MMLQDTCGALIKQIHDELEKNANNYQKSCVKNSTLHAIAGIGTDINAFFHGLVFLNKIEAVKLNIEERERSIANNVKAQLAKMTTDKASYETSQTTDDHRHAHGHNLQRAALIAANEDVNLPFDIAQIFLDGL